jgi:hypothetical protein
VQPSAFPTQPARLTSAQSGRAAQRTQPYYLRVASQRRRPGSRGKPYCCGSCATGPPSTRPPTCTPPTETLWPPQAPLATRLRPRSPGGHPQRAPSPSIRQGASASVRCRRASPSLLHTLPTGCCYMQPDSRVEPRGILRRSRKWNKKGSQDPLLSRSPSRSIGNGKSSVAPALRLSVVRRRTAGAHSAARPLRATCSHSRLVCVLTALTAALRRRHGTRALPLARGISRKESTGRANRTFGWQCCVRTAAATAALLDRHLQIWASQSRCFLGLHSETSFWLVLHVVRDRMDAEWQRDHRLCGSRQVR